MEKTVDPILQIDRVEKLRPHVYTRCQTFRELVFILPVPVQVKPAGFIQYQGLVLSGSADHRGFEEAGAPAFRIGEFSQFGNALQRSPAEASEVDADVALPRVAAHKGSRQAQAGFLRPAQPSDQFHEV